MKKILPLVLLLVGAGAGVGAGVFLRPDAHVETVEDEKDEDASHVDEDHKADDDHGLNDEEHDAEDAQENVYVKLSNQFVIPIIANEKVTALVVMALSIEVPSGQEDTIYLREPKLRDSFLQVLFDHANIGGFDGSFTDAKVLGRLRTALREVGQKDLGKNVVKDVLIIEIARQDY